MWNPGNYLSSRQGLGPESVGSPVTSGSVSEALSPRAAPSRCASFATLGCCERRTWSGGDSRATTALDGGRQRDTYLVSQAMPSRSRSSSSRYPGSPRYKGAAPASFAFLQLGKYMLSCLGSGTGAGAAAPPPAWVSSSGVGSGSDVGSDSCMRGCNGGCDGGACVVGIGDGEAVTVGDGFGVGEPASSAADGTPHPASPPQTAMARAADADLTTVP